MPERELRLKARRRLHHKEHLSGGSTRSITSHLNHKTKELIASSMTTGETDSTNNATDLARASNLSGSVASKELQAVSFLPHTVLNMVEKDVLKKHELQKELKHETKKLRRRDIGGKTASKRRINRKKKYSLGKRPENRFLSKRRIATRATKNAKRTAALARSARRTATKSTKMAMAIGKGALSVTASLASIAVHIVNVIVHVLTAIISFIITTISSIVVLVSIIVVCLIVIIVTLVIMFDNDEKFSSGGADNFIVAEKSLLEYFQSLDSAYIQTILAECSATSTEADYIVYYGTLPGRITIDWDNLYLMFGVFCGEKYSEGDMIQPGDISVLQSMYTFFSSHDIELLSGQTFESLLSATGSSPSCIVNMDGALCQKESISGENDFVIVRLLEPDYNMLFQIFGFDTDMQERVLDELTDIQ